MKKRLEAIILDFDGVIAESVNVKTRAFRELFKDRPDKIRAIERFHLQNGGMSRYDKFRHIYKDILKEELSKARFKDLCSSFRDLVVDEVVNAPYVRGAIGFLEIYYKRYLLFIVSGTPDKEIKAIIKKRNLKKYFRGIYGSPREKASLIRKIIKNNRIRPKSTVFIGDSKNDYDAARKTGVLFAGRITGENKKWIKSAHVNARFKDLVGLRRYIEDNHGEGK